jgi:hypothetical protein
MALAPVNLPHDQRRSVLLARSAAALLAAAMILTLGCAGPARWERAVADPSGKDVAALVDSDPARLLLADLLARESGDSRLAARATTVLNADFVGDPQSTAAAEQTRLADPAWLRELALGVSTDFAAYSPKRSAPTRRAAPCRRPSTGSAMTGRLAPRGSCVDRGRSPTPCCSRRRGCTAVIPGTAPTFRASVGFSITWGSRIE